MNRYGMMTKGALLLSSLLVVSGCSAGTTTETEGGAAANTDGEIVTLTFLNSQSEGTYDDVIAAFQAENPNIKVEVQSVPFSELIAQTQARLGTQDSSIDVLTVDPPRLPDMAERGFLVDVSSDLPGMKEKISDVAVSSISFDDKQWAFPVWTSANYLLYNKEILNAAGVEAPGPDDSDRWTWERLLDATKKTIDSGAAKNGITFEQVDRYYQMQPLLMSLGADAGLSGPGNLTPEVNSQKWKEFGQWYKELHSSGLAPKGVEPAQTKELFKAGELAFYLATPIRLFDIQEGDFKDKWGLAPAPYFEGGQVYTPTDSWAVGVSAFSENQEEALKFARYMALNPEGVALASAKLNLPPVHMDAQAAYASLLQQIAPTQAGTLSELIAIDTEKYAVHRPSSVGYVEFEVAINKAFSDIRNGGDVGNILDNTQDELVRQLSRR